MNFLNQVRENHVGRIEVESATRLSLFGSWGKLVQVVHLLKLSFSDVVPDVTFSVDPVSFDVALVNTDLKPNQTTEAIPDCNGVKVFEPGQYWGVHHVESRFLVSSRSVQ